MAISLRDLRERVEEQPVAQERLDVRLPQGRVEGIGSPWATAAVALQVVPVAVDEHALEFRPAEHVEAVRSVRLESNEHADEVTSWRGRRWPHRLRSGRAAHVRKCPDVELEGPAIAF